MVTFTDKIKVATVYANRAKAGITEIDFVFSDDTDFVFSDDTDFVFREATVVTNWTSKVKS